MLALGVLTFCVSFRDFETKQSISPFAVLDLTAAKRIKNWRLLRSPTSPRWAPISILRIVGQVAKRGGSGAFLRHRILQGGAKGMPVAIGRNMFLAARKKPPADFMQPIADALTVVGHVQAAKAPNTLSQVLSSTLPHCANG